MRSIRAKSLLIDFLFTAVSLPHGNDARSLIARGMGYDHQTPSQQAQSDEPFFSVGEAIIFEGDARPGKNPVCVLKAEAMLGEVRSVFGIIPLVLHFRSLQM
jgi:hypothetical protein